MKILILPSLCIMVQVLACNTENTIDVFEFGKNLGAVSFTKTGDIDFLEKNTRIPILLKPCMKLMYIRVTVENRRGPPKVDFDSDTNTMIIKYRRLQYSKSKYTVVAKAVAEKKCHSEIKNYDDDDDDDSLSN